MSDLLLRTPRATPLEYEDVDANFENLNADKLQRTSNAGVTGTISTSATTSTITGLSSNNLAVGMVVVKTAGTGALGTASTITAVDQFNDSITVVGSTSHTSGSITFTAHPALTNAFINGTVIGGTTAATASFTSIGIGTASPTGRIQITRTANQFGSDDITFGSGTVAYPTAQYNGSAALVSKGATSDGRLMIQDGNGRLNDYWNTYTDSSGVANFKYIVSSEQAVRRAMSTNTTTNGGVHSFFGAPSGTAGSTFTWTQLGSLTSGTGSTGGFVWWSPRGTSSDFYIDINGKVGINTVPSGTYQLETSGSGYFSTSLLVNTDLTVNGNTTLGDASGDTLTINASTVSTPNGLNFDSNTLVIDATNNRIGIGVASPSYPLHVAGTLNIAPSNTSGEQLGIRLFDSGAGVNEGLNITWESTDRADMASINGLSSTESAVNGGKLQFYTNPAATGTASLSAEIDQNGYMWNYVGTTAGRGAKSIVPGYLYYRLNTNFTTSTASGAQSLFGAGVNLLANTIYEFEIAANLRRAGGAATSHIVQLAFGGTRGVNNILYHVFVGGAVTTANTADAAGNQVSIDNVNLTSVTDALANAVTTVGMFIKGTISVSTTGSFIPQFGTSVALTAAPAVPYSVLAGSYVKLTPIGPSGATTNIGSWA
jgi:hypothetical protein